MSSKVIIADMCYHQVMAESMYYIFSENHNVKLVVNETNMSWPNDIAPKNIATIRNTSKKNDNFIQRRYFRFLFIINLLFIAKKNDYVIFTSGIEYVPIFIRTLWYILYVFLTQKTNVITVAHQTNIWEQGFGNIFKRILLKKALDNSYRIACLSDFTLENWKRHSFSSTPSFRLPFLIIEEGKIKSKKLETEPEKIVIACQGTVSLKRKNYYDLYNAINLLSKNERKRFQFIFQGPPISTEDKVFLEEFSKIADVDWRDYYMPSVKVEKKLLVAHIFIAPLNLDYGYGTYRESGAGFDAIKYQLPVITNSTFCSKEFASIFVDYNTVEELLEVLKKLDMKTLNRYYDNLAILSKDYTTKYWAAKMVSELNISEDELL